MKKVVLSFVALLTAASIYSLNSAAELPQKTPPAMKLADPLPANLFSELSRIINPTVVNISTSVIPKNNMRMRDPMLDMLEQFYGMQLGPQAPRNQGPQQYGLGTGFIIREDGLILTNNHVIENADIINVQLTEGSKYYEAKVIGADKRTDIALIKITPDGKLPVAALGSSKDVEVGEWVAAFGNPFGHGHSMSKGIISSKGREIGEINKIPLLQTDASINPGNSGGPLVNTKGYVIGVNSAIDARAQGIGFAIPIDEVKALIPQLEQRGRIQRGYLGAGLADLDPQAAEYMGLTDNQGAVITNLDRTGPAAKAGIKQYDVVTEFNGKKIKSATDLVDAVADAPIGKEATVKILRSQKTVNMKVKISERPDDRTANAPIDTKKYTGQKAPFNFGFTVSDNAGELKNQFGYAEDMKQPIIIEIERNSLAARSGLRVGDVILDVNKKPIESAKDVLKAMKKDSNSFRIARGQQILVISISGN